MNILIVNGTQESAVNALKLYMSSGNAEIFLNNLERQLSAGLLATNEHFIIDNNNVEMYNDNADSTNVTLGLMLEKTLYDFRLTYTTIALIALVLDICFTKGFSSFLFSMLGYDYSLVKLTQQEKCLLLKGKKSRADDATFTASQVSDTRCISDDYCCCDSYSGGECSLDDAQIENVLKSLTEKHILKNDGGIYRYVL